MANLIVTNTCNLSCGFCFARQALQIPQAGAASPYIALDAFESRLDFLERSGVNEIRLIGGEPSLHPHFPALIELAKKRQKPLVIFSHGLLSEPALGCLAALPAESCTVLVNMNATSGANQAREKLQAARLAVLRRLGPRALLGFNIFTTNFELDFMLPILHEAGCKKTIRLGLAHPALAGANLFLHPKQYPIIGRKIAEFAQKAMRAGVRIDFDCGFVSCMFSSADLETLRQARANLEWRCSPILDVDLDGSVYHCFPLSNQAQTQLFPDSLAGDLRASLQEQTRLYRLAGIYKECSTCQFKQNNECTGGCLAHTIRRFRPAQLHLRASQIQIN